MIRYLKILFAILVGLQGLFYFISNVVNFANAKGAVGYVLSQADAVAYSNLVVPPITSPILVTIALVIIMAGELSIGLLSFKGAFDMWGKRKADATEFNASKSWAILGAGMAIVVWFGGFIVFGAALLQMWQTSLGDGSFDGAFIYMATSALLMIFINQRDE